MKYSAINPEPFAMRPLVAAEMLGVSPDKFQELVHSGWIAPSVNEPRLVLHDREHIKRTWERIKRDGWPK